MQPVSWVIFYLIISRDDIGYPVFLFCLSLRILSGIFLLPDPAVAPRLCFRTSDAVFKGYVPSDIFIILKLDLPKAIFFINVQGWLQFAV